MTGSVRQRIVQVSVALVTAAAVLVPAAGASAVNVAHTSIASDNPANFTPNIQNGRVNALLVMGNRVYVGGTFTTVRNAGSNQNITRNYIFAFNATTGVVDTQFNPVIAGAVEALAPANDGQSLFIGGSFGTAFGTNQYRRLVRVNATSGQVVSTFTPRPNRVVTHLVNRNGRLYASGEFTLLNGVARSGMALLDQTTGVPDANFDLPFTDPWVDPFTGEGRMRVWRFDVTPDGSKIVAVGNFQTVGGIARQQIVTIDTPSNGPATVDSWQTDFYPLHDANGRSWCAPVFPWYIRSMDISPDGSYFVIATTGANNPAHPQCDNIARWAIGPSGAGQLPTWTTSTGGDTPETVLITGAAIYIGGHEQYVNDPYVPVRCGVCPNPFPGAVPRSGFEAHDPLNGLPFSWTANRQPRGKGVLAMVSTPTGFFFGSDTDNVAGEYHGRLGFFPLAGGTQVPSEAPYTLPGGFYTLNQSGSNGNLLHRSYDGSSFGAAAPVATNINWSTARGGFTLNGNLYIGNTNGTFTVRSFDGTNAGNASTINLYGLDTAPDPQFLIPGTNTPIPGLSNHLANMTGMFYDHGWIYYTVSGDPRLYERAFTQESRVVGAPLLVPSTGDGVDWANVRGMTMVSGNLYFALANGTLNRVAWGNGHPTGPVTTIGGPGVDGTNWASNGFFVFSDVSVPTPDTEAPSQPGKPAGTSTVSGQIDLQWAASTDNVDTNLTYRIYRDGGASPVGTVNSASTTTVSFSDMGLTPGSAHTYVVTATDGSTNTSDPSEASDPIAVADGGGGGGGGGDALFADDFSSGDFSNWTDTRRMTIDNSQGGVAAPSARAQVTNQNAWARINLASPPSSACVSLNVNVADNGGSSLDLLRLRTASNANIARLLISGSSRINLRSSSTFQGTGVTLPAGWNNLEVCGTVGTSGAWDVYLNGSAILSGWVTDTGTDPIAQVQIGDNVAKTFTANFDDVVVDTHPA